MEQKADVLIADHARKDAPAASVSWKYVTESVAKGELLNIEDYKIHQTTAPRQANAPRPVGSSIPPRGTRTPFTQQDDEILLAWVRQNKRAGKSIKGNAIYVDLAELVRRSREYLGQGVTADI